MSVISRLKAALRRSKSQIDEATAKTEITDTRVAYVPTSTTTQRSYSAFSSFVLEQSPKNLTVGRAMGGKDAKLKKLYDEQNLNTTGRKAVSTLIESLPILAAAFAYRPPEYKPAKGKVSHPDDAALKGSKSVQPLDNTMPLYKEYHSRMTDEILEFQKDFQEALGAYKDALEKGEVPEEIKILLQEQAYIELTHLEMEIEVMVSSDSTVATKPKSDAIAEIREQKRSLAAKMPAFAIEEAMGYINKIYSLPEIKLRYESPKTGIDELSDRQISSIRKFMIARAEVRAEARVHIKQASLPQSEIDATPALETRSSKPREQRASESLSIRPASQPAVETKVPIRVYEMVLALRQAVEMQQHSGGDMRAFSTFVSELKDKLKAPGATSILAERLEQNLGESLEIALTTGSLQKLPSDLKESISKSAELGIDRELNPSDADLELANLEFTPPPPGSEISMPSIGEVSFPGISGGDADFSSIDTQSSVAFPKIDNPTPKATTPSLEVDPFLGFTYPVPEAEETVKTDKELPFQEKLQQVFSDLGFKGVKHRMMVTQVLSVIDKGEPVTKAFVRDMSVTSLHEQITAAGISGDISLKRIQASAQIVGEHLLTESRQEERAQTKPQSMPSKLDVRELEVRSGGLAALLGGSSAKAREMAEQSRRLVQEQDSSQEHTKPRGVHPMAAAAAAAGQQREGREVQQIPSKQSKAVPGTSKSKDGVGTLAAQAAASRGGLRKAAPKGMAFRKDTLKQRLSGDFAELGVKDPIALVNAIVRDPLLFGKKGKLTPKNIEKFAEALKEKLGQESRVEQINSATPIAINRMAKHLVRESLIEIGVDLTQSKGR